MKDSCLSGPKYFPECGKELESYAIRCKYCDIEFGNKNQKKNHRKINKLQIECRFSAFFEHFTFK